MGMRFQAGNTFGKLLSLRTARPDCASGAYRRQTKVTYVIAHRYERFSDGGRQQVVISKQQTIHFSFWT